MLRSEKFLDRASPIAEKFYIMTRDDPTVSATQLKPSKQEQKQIDKIAQTPDYRQLGIEEKRLFWRYRHSQSHKKEVLVKFLLSVDW